MSLVLKSDWVSSMPGNNSEIFSVSALVISALALTVSGFTAWLTLLRRGTVAMTQPTVIFFGPDGPNSHESLPKVFLRTLLFSTSKRGRIVESMYVTLSCEDVFQTFDVWAYGERNELVRGSGLFVGETGIEANHHFLISRNSEPFAFIAGQHHLNVYVHLLNDRNRKLLFSQTLQVSSEEADKIGERGSGLYFDWVPEKRHYVAHNRQEPRSYWESDKPS